jgi:hypothetical protein
MKKNYFKIVLLLFVAVVVSISACKKEVTYTYPVVTAPSMTEVLQEESVVLSFDFTAEAGFKSATVTAVKGTASVSLNGTNAATSGKVEVTFIGGNEIGAGSVVLSVTDAEGQITTSTAVISIVEEKTTFSVSSNITVNTTWESGKIYILEGRIAVLNGVTLTIEPGVVVKGQVGTDVNATALIIARGAKLTANGTAASPIIFTSVADEIVPGQIASPNLLPTDNGLWGGLIILGKARGSFSGDVVEARIEGIPETDSNGLFGGTDDADNSGSITYVSIRHGGSLLGEGNEINGLTLGAVGSGTTINHVEVIGNQDDGIEWFGGAVNVSNAVIWNAGDDAVDTDMSWRGTLDNFVVINPVNSCFELDGPEGSSRIDDLNHTIQNGTIKVLDCGADLCDNDNGTNVNMNSVYFYDLNNVRTFHTMPTYTNCVFAHLEIAPATLPVATYFLNGFDAFATAVDAPTNAGADLTEFNTWSWAKVSGEF